MNRRKLNIIIYSLIISMFCSFNTQEQDGFIVNNLNEFNIGVSNVDQGSTVSLVNNVFNNVEFLFEGKITIEGASNLKLAGEYFLFNNEVFNGYVTTNKVISFRKSENDFVNNCSLTECGKDNFTNPESDFQDYSVGKYGKNNNLS